MTNEDARKIYDRLRETEAETREQNARIQALTQRVDSMLDRWDTQMTRMWKLVTLLVGALIALAIGPKFAEKALAGTMFVQADIAPWNNDLHLKHA